MRPSIPGRVTVVTPCHNSGAWLVEAADSVRAQTHDSVEHIVVDDGSTDRMTLDVLERLRSSGVLVLRQEHGGVSRARNRALSPATGEFLAPLDADDVLAPTFLATAVHALSENPTATMAAPDVITFGDSIALVPARCDSVGDFLYRQAIIQPVMRMDVVRASHGYREDLDYGEDVDLYLRLLTIGPAVLLGEPLYRYRLHPGQVTHEGALRERRARAQLMRDHLALTIEHSADLWANLHADRALLDHFSRRYRCAERARRGC